MREATPLPHPRWLQECVDSWQEELRPPKALIRAHDQCQKRRDKAAKKAAAGAVAALAAAKSDNAAVEDKDWFPVHKKCNCSLWQFLAAPSSCP